MLATYKKVSTNKSKWQNKLKEDKPKWRQFICPDNFNSQLCKNYDIDAIPRFLFFDKDGRILSLNAPRPSDERIIKYIDENLKEQPKQARLEKDEPANTNFSLVIS